MVEAVIRALIAIGILALCVVLIVWALGEFGIVIPAMVQHIILVIIILIAILILARMFWPFLGGASWFPPRPPPG